MQSFPSASHTVLAVLGSIATCFNRSPEVVQVEGACNPQVDLAPFAEYDVPMPQGAAGSHYLPSLAWADFDKNGKNDVAVSRGSLGGFAVYMRNGDGCSASCTLEDGGYCRQLP